MILRICLLLMVGILGFGNKAHTQVLEGTAAGDHFGWSVAFAGDVNNDGFDDFLVGVPNRSASGADAGQVQLFLGKETSLPSEPSLTIPGQTGGDLFGYAVSTAGDVNDDGFDDFLVGAPGRSTGGLNSGRAYLFLGGATPDGTFDMSWDGDIPQARFGASLAGGFEFNKDDRSDFAIGAPGHNGAGLTTGQVKIYLGSVVGLATETYAISGDQANWALGHSLDAAGDLNKDGFDDLVAGAPQPFDLNSGRAVVWFGQASSLVDPSRLVFSGEAGTNLFGFDVSRAGDVNGDGTDDLLVGAPQHGANHGALYLFHGGTNMNTTFDWKATGTTGGDGLGTALDGGFDFNGDGIPDFAAGAPGADAIAANAGEVRIYYGKSVPDVNADSVLTPTAPVNSFEAGDGFGTSLGFAGSLDGHNSAELAAGAPLGNGSAGAEAGYVNFINHPPDITPVRLLAFQATRIGSGVTLTWELAEVTEVAGLRLDALEYGGTRTLHSGWLPASTRSFVDSQSGRGDGTYRLSALNRVGDITLLGETRLSNYTEPIGLSTPDRNPFRDQIRMRLSIPGGRVQVIVWDVQGRQVRSLLDGTFLPGSRDITWNGRDDRGSLVPPGLYVIWSRAGGHVSSRKVLRLP